MTRLISEEIEPTFARIIGAMFARCEAIPNDDTNRLFEACNCFWWTVRGMEKIAIGVRGGLAYNNPDCVHFSLAASNHVRMVSDYIKSRIGIEPLFLKDDRDWI